jgi:hypothetical protein
MIADLLRVDIEDYCSLARSQNPLFCQARAGTLRAEVATTYLVNIHRLVGYTPKALTRARDRAEALGQTTLARHFERKMREEVGHDTWSENDLKRRGQHPSQTQERVLPSMDALLEFIDRLIDEEPAAYLSYVLFAESITVIMGPEWLQFLAARCGIPSGSISVIENHVDLDREHVEEAFDVIDHLVDDPSMAPRMREALRQSMVHFDAFCGELVDSRFEGPAESSSDLDKLAHAPAA